jgi:hypothetical protein
MALVVKDRVKETTSTTGTGTITLSGAASGYQSFSAVGDGNTTYYAIIDVENSDWEIGLGTYTASGTTLSRDTVLESSNAGSLVNFSAGTKTVFSTYPAEKSVFTDDLPTAVSELTNDSGYITGNQSITLSGDVSGTGTTSISVSLAADSVGSNEIAANSVSASELNVTGDGTSTQFLRSDGDGSFTWAVPTDTNTTYSAGSGLTLTGTTFSNSSPDQTVSLTGSGATSISGTYPSFTISSTDTNTTYTAGSGLSLSGTTFSNSAPDQTVSLTGSGATSISGTYPSFTISSTDTNTTYSAGTGMALTGTTFSIGQDVATGNSPTFANLYVGANIYHQGDTDTRILFGTNTITMVTGNSSEITVNATGVRLGDSGNGYFQPVTGNYGSVQIDGGAHGGWEGYSIGGRAVFMHDNASGTGLYNDADNEWLLYCAHNGHTGFYANGVERARLETDGDLHADGNVIAYSTTISDERLKENIVGIDGALDKVAQLNGYTFTYKTDGKISAGLIAQEVEKVLPEAVSERKLPLKINDGNQYKILNYDAIHGLLIEAIKELTARIEDLESKK